MKELLDMVPDRARKPALRRGPQLATVGAHAHESDDDTANYEADVRLKHDGLEIPQVPIAVSHVGVAVPASAIWCWWSFSTTTSNGR
jgi:hypothetical protein